MIKKVLGLLVVAQLVGCSKNNNSFELVSDEGTPLAQVGKVTITVEGVNKRINQEPPFWRKQLAENQEQKEKYLENRINRQLLVQEALKRGYLKNSEEVREAIERALIQQLTKDIITEQTESNKPTDTQIQAYFDQNKDEFNKPAKDRATYVYVPFGSDKAQSLKKASEVHKKALAEQKSAKNSSYFDKLATQYGTSDDEKNADKKLGDTGYVSEEELTQKYGEPASKSIASLAEGKVSSPLEGKTGYYVFLKSGHRDAIVKTLDDAKGMIERRLASQNRRAAFEKFIDEVKSKVGVKFYKDKLAMIKVDTSESDGMPAPGMPPHAHH